MAEVGVGDEGGDQGTKGGRREARKGPPKRKRTLNTCSHQGREGEGNPHSAARASCAQPGDGEGNTNQEAGFSSVQPGDRGGGGATPEQQRALPAHTLQENKREGGDTPEQEGVGNATPKSTAC